MSTAITTTAATLTPTAEHDDTLDAPATPKQSAAVPATEPSSNPTTPTKPHHTFAGLAGQRPLPDEPLTTAHSPDKAHENAAENDVAADNATHDNPHHHHQHHHHDPSGDSATPAKSQPSADSDVEMADGDGETTVDDDASDNESVTSESQRPSKKKKGQRFFCTDFPPCQLSFTRSEHLARHIRKHTGERPFQCHCSRRFSRLDNLRQHAQTVHVNEEIPGDSLAATSTRFQRQIRTDRVRTPGNRSRANTMGSQGGHSRGHSRNLSTSSITSNPSTILIPDDPRRPLAMAGDRDSFHNQSVLGEPGPSIYSPAYNQPTSGYTTPTSQPFSNTPTSPTYASPSFASPSSSLSRSSFYNGARHSRRLSVPSTGGPFTNLAAAAAYPPTGYYSPTSSSQASTNWSQNTSVVASPTSSVFSHSRRDSDADQEYRRRTWHPSSHSSYSHRPATSGLSYHQTPDEPRPALSHQPAASQVTRLPGIESFDHVPPVPVPTRQQPSPMLLDPAPRPPSAGRHLDPSLQHGLTRLEIAPSQSNHHPSSSSDHQWQPSNNQPAYFNPPSAAPNPLPVHRPHHMSMPEPSPTPRKNKRQAWYGGPIGPSQPAQSAFMPAHLAYRPSPEDSGSSDGVPTPHSSQGQDHHPVIVSPSDSHPSHLATLEEQQRQHHHQHHHHFQPHLPPQKVYQPPAPPTVAHAYPPQSQYSHPHDDPAKPTMPHRADSAFQSGSALLPHPTTLDQHTYPLQAGHDPRSANTYPHVPSDQHPHDMGRLEALVAVATSENRAVENRH